jgi:hypothetical protein
VDLDGIMSIGMGLLTSHAVSFAIDVFFFFLNLFSSWRRKP